MGDNISNENAYSVGPYGAGMFTGTDLVYISPLTGAFTAKQFFGDGGFLSNIHGGGGDGSGNVLTGVPGEMAYYTGTHDISGLSNITVDSMTGTINIHSNSHATNMTLMSVIFDVAGAANVGTSEYYPTLQAVCDTGNTYNGTLSFQGAIGNIIDQVIIVPGSGTNHDCSTGSVFYHSAAATDFIVNLQNLGLTSTQSRQITLIVVQGVTPRTIVGFNFDGVSVPNIFWGTNMSGHSNSVDIFRITALQTTILAENPVQLQ